MKKIIILFAIIIVATNAFGQKTSKSKITQSVIAKIAIPEFSSARIRQFLKDNKTNIALRNNPCKCAKDETLPADSIFWQVRKEICNYSLELKKVVDTTEAGITFYSYSYEKTGKYALSDISLEDALVRAMVIIENYKLIPKKDSNGNAPWIALGNLNNMPVVLFYGESCGEEKWNLVLGSKISMVHNEWFVFDQVHYLKP